MKLDYSHSGRQFFFVTLTVAGRAKILSKLVDETARPALSAVGEVVKAALLALHQVNKAVGVSDFVIMPDHLHFVLIVDYGRDRRVSPLYLSHRLLDAVEWYLERTGLRPEPQFGAAVGAGVARPEPQFGAAVGANVARPEPQFGAAVGASVARPEPQFGAVAGAAANGLRETMAELMREAIAAETAGWRAGRERKEPQRFFDRSCYIELSFDSRQLKATRRYIKLNPARAIWRLRHPDRFRRVAIPAEKLLGFGAAGEGAARGSLAAGEGSGRSPVLSRFYHAFGDVTVLGSPFFFHVRLTLKKTVAEHEAAIAEIVEEAKRGRVPVSGFSSPGEREALRRLKATPGARFVKLLPHSLPPRYDPSAEDSREIAAGRLVLLSGCPDAPAISALEMRRNSAAARAFRRNCLALNDFAARLCSR